MNLQRTVALGAACGAIAVWLAAAATSNQPAGAPVPPYTENPLEVRGADLAAEISRLRERLRPTAAPLQRRDLFRYRRGSPRSAAAESIIAAPPAIAYPLPQSAASLSLVGLAEDAGPEGPIRTAIISRTGDLFVVKEGDAVTSQYRVAAISPDGVELTDTTAGPPLRLALP